MLNFAVTPGAAIGFHFCRRGLCGVAVKILLLGVLTDQSEFVIGCW